VVVAVDDGSDLMDIDYGGADLLVASARLNQESTADGEVA